MITASNMISADCLSTTPTRFTTGPRGRTSPLYVHTRCCNRNSKRQWVGTKASALSSTLPQGVTFRRMAPSRDRTPQASLSLPSPVRCRQGHRRSAAARVRRHCRYPLVTLLPLGTFHFKRAHASSQLRWARPSLPRRAMLTMTLPKPEVAIRRPPTRVSQLPLQCHPNLPCAHMHSQRINPRWFLHRLNGIKLPGRPPSVCRGHTSVRDREEETSAEQITVRESKLSMS